MSKPKEQSERLQGTAVGKRTIEFSMLAALAIATIGCGASKDPNELAVFPTTGKITFKGQSPNGAIVALHPKGDIKQPDGNLVVPHAQVQADGTYTLSSYSANDG